MKLLLEGIKKNQIDQVMKNDDFKVGIEFEFYNEKFLTATNRPNPNETLLLGLFVDVINGVKKQNRNILNNNRNNNKKNSIVKPSDVLGDFEFKDLKILKNFFKRNGIDLPELIDLIYFYTTSAGKALPQLYKDGEYRKNVYDKYAKNKRMLDKFMNILNEKTSGDVSFTDVRKFYKNESNLPSIIKNPNIGPKAKATSDRWGITTDASVPSVLGGIEFISPPMRPIEALNATNEMFRYIKMNGNTQSYHDDSDEYKDEERVVQCGVHINISYNPERMKKFDPLKFVLFANDSQVEQEKIFGDRKDAAWIGNVLEELTDKLEWMSTTLDDKSRENAFKNYVSDKMSFGIKVLQSTLRLFDKYVNINLTHVKHNNHTIRRASSERIEIRYFGGEGYEDKIITFRRILGELLYALDVATDPTKEREKYYKKVYKLLSVIKPQKEQTKASDKRSKNPRI